ncbi:MAG TPA: diacylglycerol kinase family protein [Bacillales bacterium]|nr:diacylglycerol kinase family protein [Bacillales bacterium]
MDLKSNRNRRSRLFICFKWAFEGLMYALQTERNVRIHFTAAIVVLGAAFAFNFSYYERLLLFGVIGFVIGMELVNTAIERLVDLVSPGEHPLAKRAKDVGAAAVLTAVCVAVAVAMTIFFHHFM